MSHLNAQESQLSHVLQCLCYFYYHKKESEEVQAAEELQSNEEELEPKHTPQEPFFICSNFFSRRSFLARRLSRTLSLRCDFEGFLVVFSRPFAKRPPRPRVVRLPNFYLVGLLLLLEHTSARLQKRTEKKDCCCCCKQERIHWLARAATHI